jgi:protein TonB
VHALRFPFAAGSGLFITLAFFTLLWTFVSRPIDVGPVLTSTDIKFTRQIIDTPVEPKKPPKPTRQAPTIVPPGPRIGPPTDAGLDPVSFVPGNVVVDTGRGGGGLTIGQDREAIPYFRAPPDYPPKAAANGIEGWVQVQFAITAAGTVRDAFVVDASPKGYFEDAALKAIARWRYQPKVDGGVAVERVGLQTIIRFELQ